MSARSRALVALAAHYDLLARRAAGDEALQDGAGFAETRRVAVAAAAAEWWKRVDGQVAASPAEHAAAIADAVLVALGLNQQRRLYSAADSWSRACDMAARTSLEQRWRERVPAAVRRILRRG